MAGHPVFDRRETRNFAREIKFLLPADMGQQIQDWARSALEPDPSGVGPCGDQYATTSLYYETPGFDVFHQKESYGRAKYRIRRYGLDQYIFLERKFRTDRLLAKRRTSVPLEGLERLGEPAADPSWAGYWFHRRVLTRGLKPLVQVSYERTARLGSAPMGPIRLTIDTNLRVLPLPDRAFLPGTGLPLIEGKCILELKYVQDLPALFKQLIERYAISPGRVSKYRLGLGALDYSPSLRPDTSHA
jgi:VTC domain-containing protein